MGEGGVGAEEGAPLQDHGLPLGLSTPSGRSLTHRNCCRYCHADGSLETLSRLRTSGRRKTKDNAGVARQKNASFPSDASPFPRSLDITLSTDHHDRPLYRRLMW